MCDQLKSYQISISFPHYAGPPLIWPSFENSGHKPLKNNRLQWIENETKCFAKSVSCLNKQITKGNSALGKTRQLVGLQIMGNELIWQHCRLHSCAKCGGKSKRNLPVSSNSTLARCARLRKPLVNFFISPSRTFSVAHLHALGVRCLAITLT